MISGLKDDALSRYRSSFGFTLIELVIVLMIIALTISLAAPSLGGWSTGAKMRNACDDFLATLRLARGQAIVGVCEQIVTIDPSNGTYAIQTRNGEMVEPAPGPWGTPMSVPTGFTIDLLSGGQGGTSIVFYPDGRSTPALIQITAPDGQSRQIVSRAPAEPFRIVGGAP
jgi:general secretion pathway protein H